MGGNLIKGDFRRKGEFESQLAAFSVHTEERIFLWGDDALYAWK